MLKVQIEAIFFSAPILRKQQQKRLGRAVVTPQGKQGEGGGKKITCKVADHRRDLPRDERYSKGGSSSHFRSAVNSPDPVVIG